MPYDCGDPNCLIKTNAGKDFEGVIAYAMETLRAVFDLRSAIKPVTFFNTGSLTESPESAKRVTGLIRYLRIREALDQHPHDQKLLEDAWNTLESVLSFFDAQEQLLFRTSIRPTEPTLAEMAFCRVVDGWKFYLECLTGAKYGGHKSFLIAREPALDSVLNETRNLFVHSAGVLGTHGLNKKRHLDLFESHAKAATGSESRLVDLCAHVLGLDDGDRLLLGDG